MRVALRVMGIVLAVVSTIVWLWVGMLHLRPYTYPAGFALMMPAPGCETQCILGTQSRVTPINDAVAILEQHPAVAVVDIEQFGTQITWHWHDDYTGLSAGRGSNVMSVENGRVARISVPLDVTLENLRVMYGVPKEVRYVVTGYADVLVSEAYAGFAVTYSYSCLDDVNLLEHSPITLTGTPLTMPVYNGSKTVFKRPGCD
ncbi:MAG: hypothetical protein AAF787_17355 [Chloroflexota bacterium]